jgi:hypothetical protein
MTNSLVDFASFGTDEVLADFEKLYGKKTRRNAIIDAAAILKQLNTGGKKKIKDLDSFKKKMNSKSKKNKHKSAHSSKKKEATATQEPALDELKNNRTLTMLARHFQRARMPTFAIFSRLDKRLIKLMLIKATEYFDEDIPELRKRFFNPEDPPITAEDPTPSAENSLEHMHSIAAGGTSSSAAEVQLEIDVDQTSEEEVALHEQLKERAGDVNQLHEEAQGQNAPIATPESRKHGIYAEPEEDDDESSSTEEL